MEMLTRKETLRTDLTRVKIEGRLLFYVQREKVILIKIQRKRNSKMGSVCSQRECLSLANDASRCVVHTALGPGIGVGRTTCYNRHRLIQPKTNLSSSIYMLQVSVTREQIKDTGSASFVAQANTVIQLFYSTVLNLGIL